MTAALRRMDRKTQRFTHSWFDMRLVSVGALRSWRGMAVVEGKTIGIERDDVW